jgi:hypothetical protein
LFSFVLTKRSTCWTTSPSWFWIMANSAWTILVPRALLTRGQRSATRGSGQIHIKLASDWLQRRLLF